MTHLPYGRQTIDDDDLATVAEALRAPLLTLERQLGDRTTRFSVVRYGNVMGSAGSVIPLFRAQRKRPGTPVPADFVYSSDRAQPRLDLAATREMVERAA